MASLEQLQKAIDNTNGRTPKEVLDAFLPKGKKIGKFELVEVTYGHCLVLENLDHPLIKNKNDGWTATDLGVALFVFTRSSELLHKLIKNDEFEDELYAFLADIPASNFKDFAKDVIFHYYGSMSNAVEMDSKSQNTQKKTRLGGFLAAFRRFVGNTNGHQTT
jgi:hypothetical protein|tara:strand:- start:114 stop:602 length:489 start_codon:yes stop_codon:yes gene_type:complete